MTYSRDFRDLKVWRKAHDVALAGYRLTREFPKEELYGLTSQIRRAASSIPANIAEGCGRKGDADFSRYLQIALGSSSELEYHYLLAHDLNLLKNADHQKVQSDLIEVKRMLISFINRIKPQELRAKS